MPPKDKARVRFAGYAAVFNALDRGGDVIRPGAFAQSLKTITAIPLLWEDKRGLRVIGSLDATSAVAWLSSQVRRRLIDGLSFGYQVRESTQADGVRELLALDLVEISVVARPMQPLARIHAVEG